MLDMISEVTSRYWPSDGHREREEGGNTPEDRFEGRRSQVHFLDGTPAAIRRRKNGVADKTVGESARDVRL